MIEAFTPLMTHENIAIAVLALGLAFCGWFHLATRREDRADRLKREAETIIERDKLHDLIRENTASTYESASAIRALQATLSAINHRII